MPATCRFFLKGNCRYGANCRYYHPGEHDNNNNNSNNSQNSQQFSFVAAFNEVRKQDQSQFSTGFSFNQAFKQIHQLHHDVDMNDIPIQIPHRISQQPIVLSQPVIEYNEEELIAYSAPIFEFRRIPIRPPPQNER